MALSGFEIGMGGITSIPVVGGIIFLGYKSFGESSLDASKLKPKQKTAVKKETPAPDKKEIKERVRIKKKETYHHKQKQLLKRNAKTDSQKKRPAPDEKEVKKRANSKNPKINLTSQPQTKLFNANRKTSQKKIQIN